MASSVQLTVDGDCDCLMQESTDVVLCLSDGWEEKTLNGTKFVLGTIVSVNEKCTSVKKGNCYYPGVKSCEYVVDVLTDQFEPIDPDDEDSELWEPEDDDVESVTKSNCFYSTIIDTLVTNTRISDDEQNLLETLSDGLLVPQATIVTEYNQSGEQTVFPITATVTVTNPSTFLPMRVIGNVSFYGRFTTIASSTDRFVEVDLAIDTVSPISSFQLDRIPSSTTAAMRTGFNFSLDLGVWTNNDDDLTLLDPEESKIYEITIDGTMDGSDTIEAINCAISVTGINFSPL